MKWIKWVGALFLAMMAGVYAIMANQQLKKKHRIAKKVETAQNKKDNAVDDAAGAYEDMAKAHNKANGFLKKAKDKLEQVEKIDEKLAARVTRLNRRLRND